MSYINNEYTNPSVNSKYNMYTTLNYYNQNRCPGTSINTPLCSSTPNMDIQVIPTFNAGNPAFSYPPRYDTLQHGSEGSCGYRGYFGSIAKAYRGCNAAGASDVSYNQRPCAAPFPTGPVNQITAAQIPKNWCA